MKTKLLGVTMARTQLFLGFQLLIALLLAAGGQTNALDASAAWWPWTVILTNLVLLGLLATLLRSEGRSLGHLYPFERAHLWRDLLTVAGLMFIVLPTAMLPNILLGMWLFGDPEAPLALFLRPLPLWAVYPAIILLPVTIALSELPTYFGYVLPRLQVLSGRRWWSILLPAFFLAAQHIAMPFILDARFIIWRLGMFIPFALLAGAILAWRPRLMRYMIVIHGLMDLQLMLMLLSVS